MKNLLFLFLFTPFFLMANSEDPKQRQTVKEEDVQIVVGKGKILSETEHVVVIRCKGKNYVCVNISGVSTPSGGKQVIIVDEADIEVYNSGSSLEVATIVTPDI